MSEVNGEGNESAATLLSSAISLEKELQVVVRKKGVLEKEAHQLRRSLRLCYTSLILNHYETAAAHDVEQSLWKTIFYKVIEALRVRLRRLRSMRSTSPSDSLETELQKTSSTFSAFVTSAAKFYLSLVAKLESAFGLRSGDCPDFVTLPNGVSDDSSSTTPSSTTSTSDTIDLNQRGYMSCYRCYIFLGDLTRYIRDIGGTSSEWMEAAKYYNRALRLFPSNGNPHNQLAVLATYVNDDFNAMYHYFRSIAASHPFPTSKENLIVLFEKNRLQAENLQEALTPLLNGRRRPTENRVLRDSFLVFFIRIHGIIFSKQHTEKISQYKTLALKGFEDLLQQRKGAGDSSSSSSSSPLGISDPLLLKVFVINIYSVWACLLECDVIPGDSYSEKMKKSVLLRHTAKIAVEFFGRTVRACQQAKVTDYSFLGPLSIFTDWFVENVPALTPVSSQDKGPWHQMWKAFIALLNKLLEDKSVDFEGIKSQQGAVTPRKGSDILIEEIEMRGFLPYKEVHSHLSFSGIPLYDFSPFEIAEDEEKSRKKRIEKLLQFGVRISKLGIPCLHYSEEKQLFTDRPNKKKMDGSKTKKTTPTLAAMDPNAAPINPYDSDLSFDGMDGSLMGMPSQSPLKGHFILMDEEEYSEDDDVQPDYYYQNEEFAQYESEKLTPNMERRASFKSPNLLSANLSSISSSLRSPNMNPAISLSDFSYPFAPQNPTEYLDPKSNEPTPRSSPLQTDASNLSDFSYPFAPPPMSIDGRPIERLYSGSWTDTFPLESEVASAWNIPTGKDRGKSDVFGTTLFSPSAYADSSLHMDVNRHQSERYLSTIPNAGDGTPNRRGSLSHRLSNPPPYIPQSPLKQNLSLKSDRDRDAPTAPLPSFFLTSFKTPVKYETLEKEAEEEEDDEDVNFRTPFEMDSHSDTLPVINTGPIEDDEEEEDEQQVGISPLLYPFGAPVSPWQNSPWKTPPLQSVPPPPGFAAPSSVYYPKLSGSEGTAAHRVVSGGFAGNVGSGYARSPQVQIRWETKDGKS